MCIGVQVPISIAFNTQLSSWNWLAICDLLAGAHRKASVCDPID